MPLLENIPDMFGANNSSPDYPNLRKLAEQLELDQAAFFARASVDIIHDDAQSAEEPSEASDDACPWYDAFSDWEGPFWKILDWHETERAYANRVARATPLESKRLTALMEAIRARGDHRPLISIAPDWRTQLNVLEEQFPNFSEVIDYLRGAYALAEYGDGVPQFSPMLLNGPPGVGKTMFASAFASHFRSGLVTVRMETAQTASNLSGSSEYWGNTRSGEICNALLDRDFANPVFFLDEIDKAMEGDHDPLMALYALLEPSTARQFTDLSYPWLTLDASRIVWICTSNDAFVIPEPIFDRLRCFDIDPPTEKQARRMVTIIFDQIVSELPKVASTVRLTPKAVDALVTLSPRQIQQALREAIGKVLYAGRERVLERDVPTGPVEEIGARRMGFLP